MINLKPVDLNSAEAHLNPELLEAFRLLELPPPAPGQADLHRAQAARIFGVAYDDVTAEQRRYAKIVNVSYLYRPRNSLTAGVSWQHQLLVSAKEFDAIVAGLRLLAYERPRMQEGDGIIDILTNAGAHEGLSAEEINELADRLLEN